MRSLALVWLVVLIVQTACLPLAARGRDGPVPPTSGPAGASPAAGVAAGRPGLVVTSSPAPATASPSAPPPSSTSTAPRQSATASPDPSPSAFGPAPTASPSPPTGNRLAVTATPTVGTARQPVVATPAPNDLLFPVSRDRALPPDYVPPDLVSLEGIVPTVRGSHQARQLVIDDLRRMVAAMRAVGLNPVIASAYRSYAVQEATYAYWVRTLGQAQADRVSAKPGHSEHQLGTAIDFASAENGYELDESFATTREGRWLLANAARYGFVLSYPAGAEAVTGYAYEPWHYRYVGPVHAQAIAASGRPPIEYYLARSP